MLRTGFYLPQAGAHVEPASIVQARNRAKRRMTARAPGALDDGSPVWSQCRAGACPARVPKNANRRGKTPLKSSSSALNLELAFGGGSGFIWLPLPASSVPADRPDVALDFLANAAGRYIPRLVLVRDAEILPGVGDIVVTHVEAAGAGKNTTQNKITDGAR